MSVNTVTRKQKPKRADFRWENRRFWIRSCDYYELWDGEYDRFVVYEVADYETDEEYCGPEADENADENYPINNDRWEDFMDKAYRAGSRVLPVDPYNWDSCCF
jgi:hypothetical protein